MSLDISLYRIGRWLDTGEEFEKEVYDGNITGNLWHMWAAAGIQGTLYNSSGKKAHEITEELEKALLWMKDDAEYFSQFNSPNGWGTYVNAISFLERLVKACKEYPKAIVGN